MEFSKESLELIRSADKFTIYLDNSIADKTTRFFITASYDKKASYLLLNKEGERWENESKQCVIESIQQIRPEIDAADFLAGTGHYPAGTVFADALDKELVRWLLSLNNSFLSSINEDDLLAVKEGFHIADKLGLSVSITESGLTNKEISKQLKKETKDCHLFKSKAKLIVTKDYK